MYLLSAFFLQLEPMRAIPHALASQQRIRAPASEGQLNHFHP